MNGARVIVTGTKEDAGAFAARLHSIGFDAVAVATIRISRKKLNTASIAALQDIASYDYLLFTSARAVEFFAAAIHELQIDKPEIPLVVAIGPVTARACHAIGLKTITFSALRNKKILFPCSSIALPETTQRLEEQGAIVTKVALYTTTVLSSDSRTTREIIADEILNVPADYTIFMSPSSVHGFIKQVDGTILHKRMLETRAIAIGPTTADALAKAGFTDVVIANTSTFEGIIRTLKRLSSS